MAVVCSKLRLLFVQAPRTGCTAIEKVLMERFDGEFLPAEDILGPDGFIRVGRKHCSIPQLVAEKLLADDYRDRFTTVTTVRNPYDSLVSLYVKKREKYQDRLADPDSWVHKVRGYVQDMEFCRNHSFEEWLLKRYNVGRLDTLLGRGRKSLYGRYTAGVSVVMKFERLQEDFESVMRGLGATGDVTIPRFNATQQRSADYQSYYTPRARRIVEHVFRPDLERYGYTFEGLRHGAGTPALESTR
jgi:hypothetical protein